MELRLIIIAVVVLFSPLIIWFLLVKKRKLLRVFMLIIWLLALAIGYPVVTFAWALMQIQKHFDHDCPEVIRLSKSYMNIPYASVQINLIGTLVGRTPRYYYLANLAHCHLKTGTIKARIKAYEDLRSYVVNSNYDRQELPSIDRVLEQLRSDPQDNASSTQK